MERDELVREQVFITDLGDDGTDRADNPVCRYAAWTKGNDIIGHRIAEVSNNLQMLKEKYQVSDERIIWIK